MKRSNCYVITGGVGFGKTTLIEELCKDEKYFKIPEIAAELIEEQLRIDGNLIPWIDRYAFEEELLKRKIQAFLSATENKICFSDRGIPDAIAFFRSENKKVPKNFFDMGKKYRYNAKVFIAPPWKEIYENRRTRPQTYEESLRLDQLIKETYNEFEYKIIEIPKMEVKERTNFIINHL